MKFISNKQHFPLLLVHVSNTHSDYTILVMLVSNSACFAFFVFFAWQKQ